MVSRIELITFHILDLLELLDVGGEAIGSLTLAADGEGIAEFDLDDLCLVLKIEQVTEASCVENILTLVGATSGGDHRRRDSSFRT